MKPSNGTDGITRAWNRWVRCWKKSERYCEDFDVPMRLRGYTELTMGDLPKRERKQIDTTLRRGYSFFLSLITSTVDWDIGYLGKSQGRLWLPDKTMRDACMKHMEAQLVMTDKFDAKGLEAGNSCHRITINVQGLWSNETLKPHMTELRHVVDEHMALWARQREVLANRLLPDDAVVRLPFDSFKGRK